MANKTKEFMAALYDELEKEDYGDIEIDWLIKPDYEITGSSSKECHENHKSLSRCIAKALMKADLI